MVETNYSIENDTKAGLKTPHFSQRASRGGKGVKSPSSNGLGLNFMDDEEQDSTASSPSSSRIKRKRSSNADISSPSKVLSSPTKGKGSRWEQWEDDMVRQEIVSVGEKGADWHGLLKQINEKRPPDEPRSIHSIKFHWSHQLKAKMLH